MRYWQDLEPNLTFTTGAFHLSGQDILKFASEFDPQPYHLDKDSGDESIFGGLCASGWQVCAVLNRLISDTFSQEEIAFIGIQSISEQRWKIPVFADTTFSANLKITDCNDQLQDNEMGTISCEIEMINQDNKVVMTQTSTLLIAHAQANNSQANRENAK